MRPYRRLRALLLGVSCSLCTGTLYSAPARAADTASATPSPDAVEKAQSLFKKGAALFESKRYALAIHEFRASYDTVASPNSRLYVARCLAELGDSVQAYLEFDKVIEEAAARASSEPRYAKTQQTAQLERDELARKLALLSITVAHPDAAASLEIAGKEVPRERWGKPFPVLPGQAAIVLRSKVGSPSTQDLKLAPGETRSIALDASSSAPSVSRTEPTAEPAPAQEDVAEPKRSREHLRPYAYVAAGVGVAGFAAFTVAGLLTNSTYADLSKSCGGPCPPERQDDVDAGKRQQTIANIGAAVGAVGLAAGTTLLILSFTSGAPDAPSSTARATHLVVGPGFTGVRGTF